MPNAALPTRNKAGQSVADRGSAPFVYPLPVPASPKAIADYRACASPTNLSCLSIPRESTAGWPTAITTVAKTLFENPKFNLLKRLQTMLPWIRGKIKRFAKRLRYFRVIESPNAWLCFLDSMLGRGRTSESSGVDRLCTLHDSGVA
jgi:hypothetical protein